METSTVVVVPTEVRAKRRALTPSSTLLRFVSREWKKGSQAVTQQSNMDLYHDLDQPGLRTGNDTDRKVPPAYPKGVNS